MSLRRSARNSASTISLDSRQGASFLASDVRKKRLAGSKLSKEHEGSKRQKIESTDAKDKTFPIKSDGPTTPARTKRAPSKIALLTPTPVLVKNLRAPYSSGDIDDTAPTLRKTRQADPRRTNATLVTPGGSRATAYPSQTPPREQTDLSPTKQPTTISTILEKAQSHLISVDPRFASLIEKHKCAVFTAEGLAEEIDPFRSLTSGICGQQVSGAAATAIKNKFVALFNEENDGVHVWPSTATVAQTSIEKLRTAGLSQRKAEYIKGLAEKFVSGELSTHMLLQASDEEVMEKLIAVRGLGKWSVEMFACFGLKRLDILSTGDLGVQRGMAAWAGRDVSKLKGKGGGKWKYMSESDMLVNSEPYAPYRSLFMWYMWRVADVDTAVLKA